MPDVQMNEENKVATGNPEEKKADLPKESKFKAFPVTTGLTHLDAYASLS